MPLELQLSPLILPAESEFPGTPQELLTLISQYMAISGGESFSGVAYGDSEPAPEDRGLAWFKTDGDGDPIGWYGWDGSAWVPLPVVIPSGPTADRPPTPTTGQVFFDTDIKCEIIYYDGAWRTSSGSPGDIKHVAGTDLATVLVKNPGWSHYTDGIGRSIAGAQADGSDAETDAGAEEVTLTEAELPAHVHEDIVLTGSEADSGDAGNLVVVANSQSVGLRTITGSTTGSTGDGDPFSIIPPTRYLFTLIKD